MPQTAVALKPSLYPCVFYQDAPAAIEWLVKAFGFEKLMIVSGSDGSIVHAELSYELGAIMVGSVNAQQGWASPRGLPAVNQALYLSIENPDQHYARAKAAGAEIIMELTDTEHGSRDYAARDLEGHHWYFGTYAPDLSLRAE
jgi:uncharacterized glyoxalase superfamily protein PhnB